jgi:hypothetical protein
MSLQFGTILLRIRNGMLFIYDNVLITITGKQLENKVVKNFKDP